MPAYTTVGSHYEQCARHTSSRVTRSLQTLYLCDPCARRLVHEAFNDRAPVFHGESVTGYCGLCNSVGVVTMRQWFVCPTCWNVVVAFQKSSASAVAVAQWWETTVHPLAPDLCLRETEPMKLIPYVQRRVSKRADAEGLSVLDFAAFRSETADKPIFHIELKTGPGSIEQMSEFQLDVNDYNDIVGATNLTKAIAYIVHAQAVQDYIFPTRGTRIERLWWTNVIRLSEHQKRIGFRQDEKRRAIFFFPSAFQPIESFVQEIVSAGYGRLSAAVEAAPLSLVD